MAKAENKTKPTEVSVRDFVSAIEPERRRNDAQELLTVFASVTGLQPKLWGPSLIGYGTYHYKYESGREGDFFMSGFSPRKTSLVIYTMPGYGDHDALLLKLGKHKLGKSCLYINKLADVKMDVLQEIISEGFETMKAKYPDWKA
jgi:hypothetical protein